jgi:hypothetical protein
MTAPPPDVAEHIRYKKSQYTRFADSKQWHRFDTIFVPDATFCFVDQDGKVVSTPMGPPRIRGSRSSHGQPSLTTPSLTYRSYTISGPESLNRWAQTR